MGCQCPVPRERPYQPGSCRECGRVIDPAVVATTEKLQGFLDRVPNLHPALAQLCHVREQAGREQFGLRYLGRDNIIDMLEEVGDGINYLAFTSLVDRRAGATETDPALIEAAHHLALAFNAVAQRG